MMFLSLPRPARNLRRLPRNLHIAPLISGDCLGASRHYSRYLQRLPRNVRRLPPKLKRVFSSLLRQGWIRWTLRP